MALSLSAQFGLTGNAVYTAAGSGVSNQARMNIAAGDWAAMLTGFSTGSADTVTGSNGLGNVMYAAQRSCLATANDNLDLAGSLTMAGVTMTFTKVKLVLIQIVSPDGTKLLRVGPQNISNAWQGPFTGGAGATVYKEVMDWEFLVNQKWAGYAVTAGTGDILGIYNPGATTVTYNILIIGR